MSVPPEIYLDMDGVCVDFIGAAMKTQGYDADLMLEAWRKEHPGSLYPEPLMDKTATEFFTHNNMHASEFWSGLVPYYWFEHLFDELGLSGYQTQINTLGCGECRDR